VAFAQKIWSTVVVPVPSCQVQGTGSPTPTTLAAVVLIDPQPHAKDWVGFAGVGVSLASGASLKWTGGLVELVHGGCGFAGDR
jgi:hypothetical protein